MHSRNIILKNLYLEKEGIKIHSFKSGKYKNAGNPYEPLSEELENKFQEMVNESADIFFNQVSKARNIDKEKIKNLIYLF